MAELFISRRTLGMPFEYFVAVRYNRIMKEDIITPLFNERLKQAANGSHPEVFNYSKSPRKRERKMGSSPEHFLPLNRRIK